MVIFALLHHLNVIHLFSHTHSQEWQRVTMQVAMHFGTQCLAHFDMWTVGDWDKTANRVISG